jgi:hypothetical protein
MLRVPGCYRLWPGFPTCSAARALCNSLEGLQPHLDGPTTPSTQRLKAWHADGLGYGPLSLTTTQGVEVSFFSSGY